MEKEKEKEIKILHVHITAEDFASMKGICKDNSRTIKGQLIHWIRNNNKELEPGV